MLLKYGEANEIQGFRPAEAIIHDKAIHERFKKIAADIKKIAPKAEDFLYFTAIMMHASERSLYDENGNLLKNADGSDVWAKWEINEKTGSWKWVCSNPAIKPYKNANGDSFPENQLKIAYKKWIGKPLCKDHQSSSVDGIRGIILDTYWDDKHKRIIALCALDKVNYPDLATKVAIGTAHDCSMGCGVGKAICFNCGNVATTEDEYSNCIRTRSTNSEINTELNPIELSLVVNGADTNAKILEVLAAAEKLQTNLTKMGSTATIDEINSIRTELNKLAVRLDEAEKEIVSSNDNNFALKSVASFRAEAQDSHISLIKNKLSTIEDMLKSIASKLSTEDLMTKKTAYYQGTEEPTPGKPQYEKEEADMIRMEDSHMRHPLTDLGPVDGIPKDDMEKKKMTARAKIEERRALRAAAVERAQKAINQTKVAYVNSGEKQELSYTPDPGAKVRDTEFTFNKGNGQTGLWGDDEKVKEKLSRASLKAKLVKAANAGENRWDVISTADNKVVFSATFDELTGKRPVMYQTVASNDFAKQIMKTIRASGIEKAASMLKSAQVPPTAPPADMGAPPAPPADMGAAPPPADAGAPPADMGAEAPPAEEGKEGTPEQELVAGLEAVTSALTEVSSLLEKLIPSMKNGVDALKGEKAELPTEELAEVSSNPEQSVEEALADLSSPEPQQATASLSKIRIVVNAGLRKEFAKTLKSLASSQEEIELLLATASNKNANKEVLIQLGKDILEETQATIRTANILRKAFVKYAKGTYQLEKRAAMEKKLTKLAARRAYFAKKASPVKPANAVAPDDEGKSELATEVEDENKTATASIDMSTVEGRRAYRRKLAAATGMKFSDMLDKAHPKGGTVVGDVAGDKGMLLVEDLKEVHQDMEDAVRTAQG